MKKFREDNGITLLALIITIIVLVILAGVAINTLYGENGIISNAEDAERLSNIKTIEEGINLYKIDKNLEGKVQEESYPIALNEDGSKITLSQMKSASELAKLPDGVKYILLNLTAEKGTTNIPTFEQIDYSQFYKLDYTKLNMSEEEAENLVIYIEGDNYKVINLAGIKYKKSEIYVVIPLNNEAEPEYIAVANNTYKLYGDGTLKALGEKTVNSGYTNSEVNEINNSWDEFDLKSINERFDNRMNLPETLTSDWYAGHVYFSTGTAYVIDQNNDLWAWGANDYNKLGLGHSFLVVEPTKILEGRCEGKENVKASKVWAGNYNTFIVDTEGMLWACGNNGYGTLGQGNNKAYNNWVKIDYINGNEIKQIQVSEGASNTKAVIIMKDGTVYGGGTNNGQFGDRNGGYYTFKIINEYKNIKKLELGADVIWYITKDNVLYGCGYGAVFGKEPSESPTPSSPYKIAENIKDVKTSYNHIIYITNDNKLYYRNSGSEAVEVNNIKIDENTKLLSKFTIITNEEYYIINNAGAKKLSTIKALPYINKYENEEIAQNYDVYIIQGKKGEIYIKNEPNITKVGEKSNYSLRQVMKNVKFIQGKGENISIVTQNGEIYEKVSQNANSKIKDARKIISSSESKYVIKNDGTLWAKGTYSTGMWGEPTYKGDYVQVTKDGTNAFTNVKDIFTSTLGCAALFITEDNKIYWAGEEGIITFPQTKGDYKYKTSILTYYPKEVTSPLIEKIIDKIKDIEYSYINRAGITGRNTLILTEDGKLYTMSNNRNMSGNSSYADITNGDFTELTIKEGTTLKQVITEDGLSLALLSNGEVYGWGYNTYGILGPNYEIGGVYPTPVKLEGLPANIRYMSLGNGFAIFASKSGEVYGIGKNDYGQLGTGDSVGRTEFVRCTKLEE